MAFLFCDSFDHYATADILAKWTSSFSATAAFSISAGSGRRATGCFRVTISGPATAGRAGLQKTLVPASATVIGGMAIKVPSGLVGTNGLQIAAVQDGATTQVTLRLNADYTLSVVRGTAIGTVLGTTAGPVLAAGVFAFVEWKVKIDPTVGTVDLRVNGAVVLSLTGQNTRTTAASQWSTYLIGQIDSNTNSWTTGSGSVDFDDLYVLDGSGSAPLNDFLGDVRVDACYPSGAGSNTGWTPSAGANYTCVDDAAPNADTDYVSATSSPLTDTYATQDAPVVGATLYAVQLCINAKKSDAGACTLAPIVRHSGADNAGATFNPGTSYNYGITPYGTNPGTGAAWTEAGFNAAEFGVRRTA